MSDRTIESCWRCGRLTTVVDGRCSKCSLDLSEEWLRHQERMQTDEPANEKRRRVYYQDIVYAVCNRLDKVTPGTTVCGSWAEPSTNVQDRLDDVIQRWSDARDRIESLEAELKALRYVMSHVPSRVLMEATNKAGCPTLIVPASAVPSFPCEICGEQSDTVNKCACCKKMGCPECVWFRSHPDDPPNGDDFCSECASHGVV